MFDMSHAILTSFYLIVKWQMFDWKNPCVNRYIDREMNILVLYVMMIDKLWYNVHKALKIKLFS